jgi:hypothetical protein
MADSDCVLRRSGGCGKGTVVMASSSVARERGFGVGGNDAGASTTASELSMLSFNSTAGTGGSTPSTVSIGSRPGTGAGARTVRGTRKSGEAEGGFDRGAGDGDTDVLRIGEVAADEGGVIEEREMVVDSAWESWVVGISSAITRALPAASSKDEVSTVRAAMRARRRAPLELSGLRGGMRSSGGRAAIQAGSTLVHCAPVSKKAF